MMLKIFYRRYGMMIRKKIKNKLKFINTKTIERIYFLNKESKKEIKSLGISAIKLRKLIMGEYFCFFCIF